MSRPAAHRVLLLTDMRTAYGRGIALGVARVAVRQRWDLRNADLGEDPVGEATDLAGYDGIVGLIRGDPLAERLLRSRRPVVNVSSATAAAARAGLTSVISDDEAVGRLAANHLLARGLRDFAFSGREHEPFARERGRGFRAEIARAGARCHEPPAGLDEPGPDLARWRRDMGAWLGSLAHPLGVLAHNDYRARQILQACQEAGLAVPERIAVLGVDDDETICAATSPPLSSVALPSEHIGAQAAELLAGMIAGAPPPPAPLRCPPLRVSVRASCDVVAVADREVALALRFIRDALARRPSVEHVAAHVALSRRALERRFRQVLRRSPAGEIRRVQIETARRLLADPALPLARVATLSGFASLKQFRETFTRVAGMSPSRFRERSAATSA